MRNPSLPKRPSGNVPPRRKKSAEKENISIITAAIGIATGHRGATVIETGTKIEAGIGTETVTDVEIDQETESHIATATTTTIAPNATTSTMKMATDTNAPAILGMRRRTGTAADIVIDQLKMSEEDARRGDGRTRRTMTENPNISRPQIPKRSSPSPMRKRLPRSFEIPG